MDNPTARIRAPHFSYTQERRLSIVGLPEGVSVREVGRDLEVRVNPYLATAGAYRAELHYGTPGETRAAAPLNLTISLPPPTVLSKGALIVCEGDSLTYGQDTNTGRGAPINGAPQTRSATPYPETLAGLLDVTVINRGFPGDRTSEGLKRWKDQAEKPDLTVLMYGSNDWRNFGGYKDGPLPVATYKENLTALVKRRQEQGSQVIVLSPPPTRIPLGGGLDAYVEASREVATQVGVPWLNTGLMLREVEAAYSDDVHLNAAGYQAIARGVRAYLEHP